MIPERRKCEEFFDYQSRRQRDHAASEGEPPGVTDMEIPLPATPQASSRPATPAEGWPPILMHPQETTGS
ncbi:hypothetical protein TNCV_611561 [Trichonephila clavipes]|nr:hypothetical protein TNCV_611561 [Trichonephila clavipes]